jgi:hypothetical protein
VVAVSFFLTLTGHAAEHEGNGAAPSEPQELQEARR